MVQSIWCEQALLPGGWARDVRILHEDGLIARIEAGAPAAPDDARCAVALPGLGDLHSHAFQRAMSGLTERSGATPDSFWTWRELMYRFVGRLTPEGLQAIAAMAQVEMLEGGFTRVGEFHYLHHDLDGSPFADPAEMGARIAAAAAETGIGLTLLPVFYAHSDFGGAPPSHGQRRFISDLDGFGRLLEASRAAVSTLPDAVVGVAPHSLRAVTGEALNAVSALAAGGPVHIHIAEQVREVEACLAATGRRPVDWLLNNAAVDGRWCLVHATHVDAAELEAMARSGAVAGLCPITEANLGDGLFPAAEFIAAGGLLGVGSDSNVLIDAAEELRLLEYGQRLSRRGRAVLSGGPQRSTGANLFGMAMEGGASALAGARGLAQGEAADLFTLDCDHPSLVGREGDDLIDSWIFGGARGALDRVWRRGRLVVAGGRHVAREAIAARYAAVLKSILA